MTKLVPEYSILTHLIFGRASFGVAKKQKNWRFFRRDCRSVGPQLTRSDLCRVYDLVLIEVCEEIKDEFGQPIDASLIDGRTDERTDRLIDGHPPLIEMRDTSKDRSGTNVRRYSVQMPNIKF